MSLTYDVIIVGASFAGLAVARELKGRVLVVDRNPIGTIQTSACGTLVEVPIRFTNNLPSRRVKDKNSPNECLVAQAPV